MFESIYLGHNGCEPIWFEHEKMRLFCADKFGLSLKDKENADILILTICTFTEQKEKESVELINDCLRTNAKKVIVTGCFLKKYVDNERVLYLKHNELTEFLIANFKLNSYKPITNLDKTLNPIVAISKGCYGKCSFCSIKFAKGNHVSRPMDEIIDDIEKIVHHGYIKLIGDDIAAFGKDSGASLYDLVSEVHKQFPAISIKFGSLNVKHLKKYPDIEITMFAEPYINGNIHMPVQSASNRILDLMQRDYQIEDYERIYDKLRGLGANNMSTDIIIGFPGETENDHKRNLEFIENHDFNFVEFFMYQVRQGTKAAGMKQLAETIKRKRTIEAIGVFINGYMDKRAVPLTKVEELMIFNSNIKTSWKR